MQRPELCREHRTRQGIDATTSKVVVISNTGDVFQDERQFEFNDKNPARGLHAHYGFYRFS